ncbi:MAG: ABC transporter ATP-binding protein/permease [Oscillospiraceae bacterium]|jgi:ATP-binding cassette subfamily B protein|nr:ABC transporter ATP-binding protein/permease [Oscillospiraceae bacterium]
MGKVFKGLKPWAWIVALAGLIVFAQALCELNLPALMSDIVNEGVMRQDTNEIWTAGLKMLAVTAGSVISAIVAAFLFSRVAAAYARRLRRDVFEKVMYYSNDQQSEIGTASLITRSTNDVTQIQNMLAMSRLIFFSPFMGIGGVIMAVRQAPGMAWIIAVVVAGALAIMGLVMKVAMPLFTSQQKKLDKLNLVLRESLTGVRIVRAFNRTAQESERFDRANRDLNDTMLKIVRIMSVVMPVMMLFMNATSLTIVWFGAIKIDAGTIQVGDLFAFIQYVMQILFSLMMFTMMTTFIPRASVSADRIYKILDSQNEILPPEQPQVPTENTGKIEFKNVTFRFKGAQDPVLKNISFTADPGKTTAIIGSTGSGKSTLIELISRNYDIESGELLVDGVDVRQYDIAQLRSRISLVPQTAVLFSGTVAENLRFGKREAEDEELQSAVKIAQAQSFVEKMPEGYESFVSQGGTNLSGGQKQRLSIARALVRRPEIYIFDDSFSALDFKTDAKLRAALKTEVSDATVLVVAQRVSTIMDADKILVLNDGELAGTGTHRELLETCEVYREIVFSQLSKEEIA